METLGGLPDKTAALEHEVYVSDEAVAMVIAFKACQESIRCLEQHQSTHFLLISISNILQHGKQLFLSYLH